MKQYLYFLTRCELCFHKAWFFCIEYRLWCLAHLLDKIERKLIHSQYSFVSCWVKE